MRPPIVGARSATQLWRAAKARSSAYKVGHADGYLVAKALVLPFATGRSFHRGKTTPAEPSAAPAEVLAIVTATAPDFCLAPDFRVKSMNALAGVPARSPDRSASTSLAILLRRETRLPDAILRTRKYWHIDQLIRLLLRHRPATKIHERRIRLNRPTVELRHQIDCSFACSPTETIANLHRERLRRHTPPGSSTDLRPRTSTLAGSIFDLRHPRLP